MRRTINGHPIVRVHYPDQESGDYGYAFIWPSAVLPPIGAKAFDNEYGKPVIVVGYGTTYPGPLRTIDQLEGITEVSIFAKPPISPAKVTTAVLTAGLSLPFTRGLRKHK